MFKFWFELGYNLTHEGLVTGQGQTGVLTTFVLLSGGILSLRLVSYKRFFPAGGGVTLRGSDGQLHPRAPPKPLRISAVFPNAVIPPPIQRDEDPSSFYDELVVQVTFSFTTF